MNNYFLTIKRTGGNGRVQDVHGFKSKTEAMAAKKSLERVDADCYYRYTITDSSGRVIVC